MNFLGRKLIRYIYYFLLLVSYFSLSFAQAPDTLWTKTYGGRDHDYGKSVQETADGGYIVTGITYSFGAGLDDVYLIRTDANGDTLWTRTYGGPNYEGGRSVQQTSDGGYIIAGAAGGPSPLAMDVYLIKTDSIGDTLWTRTYGGLYQDEGYAVQQTSDGGYIIAGFYGWLNDPDFYLVKTDEYGDTLWTKTYGGTGIEISHSVQQTSDNGYIVVGYTDSYGGGNGDVYLVKTHETGDTLWTRTFGGTEMDYGESVQQTSDGAYIIAGDTDSFGASNYDVYLVKTDANGDVLWTNIYGGNEADGSNSVHGTADGGYIITGYTYSFGGAFSDVYFIKVDSLGDTLWTRTYGGINGESGESVQQTSDGGYIIAGSTRSFGAGEWDVYLIKTAPEPGIEEEKVESIRSRYLGATIFSGSLLLPEGKKCRVFDITGRVIMPNKMRPGVFFVEIDGEIVGKVVRIK